MGIPLKELIEKHAGGVIGGGIRVMTIPGEVLHQFNYL